jgi:minor extracellular serine protease Vpr
MSFSTEQGDVMRRRWRLTPAVLVAVLAMSMAGPARATSGDRIQPDRPAPWDLTDVTGDAEFVENLWFVEFASAPAARGGNNRALRNERAQFQRELQQQAIDAEQQRDFDTLWNGVTVRADVAAAQDMQSLRSVTAVYPVAVIEQPEPTDVSPELATALTMTGADAAQSELGLTGEGLSVAIIDTGIDYNHPDLGGDGVDMVGRYTATSSNNRVLRDASGNTHPRVTHGWDYVGSEFNPADPDAPPMPSPDPDPRDTQGHGTHVAGIVGASGAVTGVAPDVTFGAYKVFGPGSTTGDIIVEALEDAYADGMDIVNMSLGAAFAWGQDYPTTAASNELAAQGVAVINSAGNSGGDGLWTLSAPANAHDIISVASADNTEQLTNVFLLHEDGNEDPTPIPYLELEGAEPPPTEGESDPLWSPPVTTIGATTGPLGCAAEDFVDMPEDSTALIMRGVCPFADKYVNAANAGATGVIIFNNVSGLFAGTVGGAGIDGVWGAGISDGSGQLLLRLLENDMEVTLEFTDQQATTPNPTAGLASSFTSYGQDVELQFGPSVMAPGGLIVSTYPLARGGQAMLSGTSMAAPHVAGAVALLWEAEGKLDPIETRTRLQNTAEPALWSLNAQPGLLEHTFRQGAGMIQIDQAILAEQFAHPGQLSLADAPSVTTTVALSNEGETPVAYTLGHDPALEVAVSTFAPDFFLAGASVAAPETVTVAAGSTTQVEVTITAPRVGLPNHQYGGYLVFEPENEDASTLRVPYVGFAGDYADGMPLLGTWYWGPEDDDEIEFVEIDPVLAVEDGDEYAIIEDDGHVFRTRAGEYPVVAPFFGHFPQEMELWAVDQTRDRRYLVMQDEYLSRSSALIQRYPFEWDGTVRAGNSENRRGLPSSHYTLELRVLRAMGDADNSEHWDTWESPEFELDARGPATTGNQGQGPGQGRGPGR